MRQRIFWLLIIFSLTGLLASLAAAAVGTADRDQSTAHARASDQSIHATWKHASPRKSSRKKSSSSSTDKHRKIYPLSRRQNGYQQLERLTQHTDTDLWFCRNGFDQGDENNVLTSSSCPVAETVLQWLNTIMGDRLTAQMVLVEVTEDTFAVAATPTRSKRTNTPLLSPFFAPLGRKNRLGIGEFSQMADIWLQERSWLFEDALGNTRTDEDDTTESSSPFGYRYTVDRQSAVHAGAGWIYDIGDTTGMMQDFGDAGYDIPSVQSGVNLTLGYSFDDFTITGGYIRAVEGHGSTNTLGNEQSGDPAAWNSELAYATKFLNKTTVFSVGYMRSSDALASYLPEERYSTKASIFLQKKTTFSLEYYQDRPFSEMGMDNSEGYGITTRLGFHF